MTSSSIINGFKCCGIFPFNPRAVLKKISSTSIASPGNLIKYSSGVHGNVSHSHVPSTNTNVNTTVDTTTIVGQLPAASVSSITEMPSFTLDEEKQYIRRFEEGYDLSDEQYSLWLAVNNLPASTPACKPLSVTECLTDVTPVSPLTLSPFNDTSSVGTLMLLIIVTQQLFCPA